MGLSRREMLKRGLALIGSAVGLGAVGGATASAVATQPLLVRGANFGLQTTSAGAGPLARPGDRMFGRGDIEADAATGTFYATRVGAEATGHVGADGVSAMEWHTFAFADGTLVGVGATSQNVDRTDTFAIIGGTGRFAGARGTYTALQRHRELGGDGTAEFHMQFETRRA